MMTMMSFDVLLTSFSNQLPRCHRLEDHRKRGSPRFHLGNPSLGWSNFLPFLDLRERERNLRIDCTEV